ncbi:MAG: hypothetical protein K2X38_06165 [Gemmataceae bacterium]|nr:hypothetical protein [Gemmataceae bacterium]
MKSEYSIYLQLPLVLALISVIYSATRHDEWGVILAEAFRWGVRMLGFMACVGLAMYALTLI